MSGITDELRAWSARRLAGWKMAREEHDELAAIADRIDAEHERQCAESWMRGHDAWAAIDRSDEMAEHGWVRLPKDADGEYIHIGDVMVYADGNTCPLPVVALVPPAVFLTDDGPRYADMCRHAPDTWERIIEDATALGAQMGRRTTQVDDLVARCKALCERTKEVGE